MFMSHDMSCSSPTVRKPRVTLACKRCKRRKQRCDGERPVCTSCDRAGTQCIYEKAIRPQYPGGKTQYINMLEERIAFLEARLPAYAEDHFEPSTRVSEGRSHQKEDAVHGNLQSDSMSSHNGSTDETEGESTSLVDGVAYLSLCASGTADTVPDPAYLGSSSGATIARMIQTSLFRSSGGSAFHGLRSLRHTSIADQGPFAKSPAILIIDTLEFPPLAQARLLFETFFDRLHTRWPLLDRKEYEKVFEQQYDQNALSIMHRCIMHLIYAIAARFLQLTKHPHDVDPEKHLIAAIKSMDYMLEQHNLGTVQFLLLLALYGQRSPYGAGSWSQVRYAVSLCIELGLHRERRIKSAQYNARDLEMRRRAFWCCYCLDRATSMVLGRAFAISDRDVNVKMPDPNIEFWDMTHKESPDVSQPTLWSNIEPFIHVIKLECIHSRIHQTVFRVDRDVASGSTEEKRKRDSKMALIQQDLETWIKTIPMPPKNAKRTAWMYDPESPNQDSQDFFNLQYHKAVLALFTGLLPILNPSDPRFFTCARSSVSVCIAYKRLNQQSTLSYTMISLHSCFVAGLTLIYCLWRNPALFGYEMLEATQACSQSLTIFGEKWSGAVKYRDIFDALSGNLIRKLVHPNQSADSLQAYDRQIPPGQPSMIERHDAYGTKETSGYNLEDNDGLFTESSMSQMISEAVEETFMEVDEEAPGGWQGWRMWTEMMGDVPQGSHAGWEFDVPTNPGFNDARNPDWDIGATGNVR